jgi:hypothetical protein
MKAMAAVLEIRTSRPVFQGVQFLLELQAETPLDSSIEQNDGKVFPTGLPTENSMETTYGYLSNNVDKQ